MTSVLRLIPLMAIALCLTACRDKKADAAAALEKGRTLYAAGDYQEAKVAAQKAISLGLATNDAFLVLGEAEEGLGDVAGAFADYTRAAGPDFTNVPAQLKIVDLLLGAGQINDALARVTVVLGTAPDDPDARGYHALIKAILKQDGPAQSEAGGVLAKDPDNILATLAMAQVALNAGRPAAALPLVDAGLAAHPDDNRLGFFKANVLLLLNREPEALALYRQLAVRMPRNARVSIITAELQQKAGDAGAAEATLRAALKRDEGNQDLLAALLRLLAAGKGTAAAEDEMRALIAAAPARGDGDVLLAQMQIEAGQDAAAAATLEAAVKRLGAAAAADRPALLLARLRLSQGAAAAAWDLVNAVAARSPDNAEALLMRADLNRQGGRPDLAVGDLLALLRIQPGNAIALQMLSLSYATQGDRDHALDAMRRAADSEPDDMALQLRLLSLLQSLEQTADFNRLRTTLASRYDGVPDLWLTLARLAVDHGDWVQASDAINHLKGLPDGGAAAYLAQGIVAIAQDDPAAAYTALGAWLKTAVAADDPTLLAFARAALRVKQGAAAIDLLRQAAGRGVSPVTCELLVARLAAAAGDEEAARAAFARALAAAPGDARPYADYAKLLIEGRRFPEAHAILEQGRAAGVAPEPLDLAEGDLLLASDRGADAMGVYHAILSRNPRALVAANNYASLVADLAPRDKAKLKEARGYLTGLETSNDPSLVDSIAWLEYRLGHADAALALLRRAGVGPQSPPQLRYHLGAVLIAAGERPAGKALLESVAGLSFPGHEEAASLLAAR